MKSSHHYQQSKVEFSQNPTRRNGLTRLLFTLIAALAFLALSATSARAFTNYLANPGFEAGTTAGWSMVPPWTWNPITSYSAVQNTSGFVYPSTTVHVMVHGGTSAAKIWGYNQNTYTTTPGLQQTIPASPGSQWTADGWVSTQVPDNMRGNSAGVGELAYLRVLFLDNTTNYNAPLANYTSASIDTNTPTGTWVHLQVTDGVTTTLTAPVGTAVVRYEAIFSQPSVGGVNPGGSSYWDDLQLLNVSKPDPEITIQPAPVTKVYGQTATFTVTADGLSTLSYKWQKDGADITDPNAHGVTTSTLTLSNVTVAMQGNYTVTVTDSAAPLTSNPAFLTVNDPGFISITPAFGQTVVVGTNITMTVTAAGSTTPTYAWYKDGNPLSNNGHYSGVTTPTLAIANVTTSDTSPNYTVLVNGGMFTATNGLKVITSTQYATNLLVNPGFEDSVLQLPWETAWGKFNGVVIASTNDYYYLTGTPVSVKDGNYVCQVYGSDADDGYNQTVPATAGMTYHAGGWFYMSSASPLAGAVTVTLQFSFKDAVGGNTLASFSAPQFSASSVTDTWTSLQVTNATGGVDLVAPAGTAALTVQVYEFNWSYAGGSVYADDFYVSPVVVTPPPLPPAFSLKPSVSSGQFNLSFQTTNGAIYEVLYSGNAASALSTWQTNTTIIGDGSVRTVPDTLSAGARFYRVRAHNP